MARSCLLLLILLVLLSSPATSCRKLLNSPEYSATMTADSVSPAKMSLFLSALPKGTVRASSPSKKGHSETTDEKLIVRHLIAIDRILRSVPSPGVGH